MMRRSAGVSRVAKDLDDVPLLNQVVASDLLAVEACGWSPDARPAEAGTKSPVNP
jgi:hypothetical protein